MWRASMCLAWLSVPPATGQWWDWMGRPRLPGCPEFWALVSGQLTSLPSAPASFLRCPRRGRWLAPRWEPGALGYHMFGGSPCLLLCAAVLLGCRVCSGVVMPARWYFRSAAAALRPRALACCNSAGAHLEPGAPKE